MLVTINLLSSLNDMCLKVFWEQNSYKEKNMNHRKEILSKFYNQRFFFLQKLNKRPL